MQIDLWVEYENFNLTKKLFKHGKFSLEQSLMNKAVYSCPSKFGFVYIRRILGTGHARHAYRSRRRHVAAGKDAIRGSYTKAKCQRCMTSQIYYNLYGYDCLMQEGRDSSLRPVPNTAYIIYYYCVVGRHNRSPATRLKPIRLK